VRAADELGDRLRERHRSGATREHDTRLLPTRLGRPCAARNRGSEPRARGRRGMGTAGPSAGSRQRNVPGSSDPARDFTLRGVPSEAWLEEVHEGRLRISHR